MKDDMFPVCPRCGSRDVVADLDKTMVSFGGIVRMKCDECEYEATIFPEMDEENHKRFIEEINSRSVEEQQEIDSLDQSKLIGTND